MFFALNEFGSARLSAAFDLLPIPAAQRLDATARFLDVSPRTLSAWLSGKSDPPRSACYAIWHESPAGLAATAAHSEQSAHLWRTLAKSQETELALLRARIDTLTDDVNALKASRPDLKNIAANEDFLRRY